jgi:hypothetical protein
MPHLEPTKSAPFVVDARGRRVSPRLAAPFGLRARMMALARTIAEMHAELLESYGYRAVLGDQAVSKMAAMCDDLEQTLQETAPAIPCSCAKDATCEHCGGQGWLNATQIRRLILRSQSAESSVLFLNQFNLPASEESGFIESTSEWTDPITRSLCEATLAKAQAVSAPAIWLKSEAR